MDMPKLQTMSVRTRPIVPDTLRDPGAVIDAVKDAQAKQRAAQTPVGTLSKLKEGRVAEWLTMTAKLMQTGRGGLRVSVAQPLRTAVLPDLDPVNFDPRDRLAGRPPRL
jgi:hypothetical protein